MAVASAATNATGQIAGQTTVGFVIFNWLMTGHPLPVPAEVTVAMWTELLLVGAFIWQLGGFIVDTYFPAAEPLVAKLKAEETHGGA